MYILKESLILEIRVRRTLREATLVWPAFLPERLPCRTLRRLRGLFSRELPLLANAKVPFKPKGGGVSAKKLRVRARVRQAARVRQPRVLEQVPPLALRRLPRQALTKLPLQSHARAHSQDLLLGPHVLLRAQMPEATALWTFLPAELPSRYL